jgi:hypothetical protein
LAVSLRRILTLGVLMAVFALVLPLLGAKHASARGYITVTPSSGSQYDYYEFDATGFVPGERIHIYFISPGGDEFDWVNSYDGTDGVIVDRYGDFSMVVHPVDDFSGSQFGDWEAHFESDRDTEVVLDFIVD